MTCKNCGREITKRGFDWVHKDDQWYRCSQKPQPDPQKYAEPKWEEA